MRVRILGSAAAEGWPALFCECDACRDARRLGGRNLRRRTAYAVDDDLLVDFGPDINWQTSVFGIDLSALRRLLVTHSHEDHLDPVELSWRRRGFSVVTGGLEMIGNETVRARLMTELPFWEHLGIEYRVIQAGETLSSGPYRITALEAQHAGPNETALNYVVEKDRASVLIANDTGWWPDCTWEQIRAFRLDLAILECTYLCRTPDQRNGHLGSKATADMKAALAELGALAPGARVVANHFSHNGLTLHDDLVEYFRPHGIEVGYDGMDLEVKPPLE